MARKNGKTGLVAPIALYGLMLEGEGAEVYSCAADRDQAKLVFGAAKRTVELVPELSGGSSRTATRSRIP
jgi:phage terminase large subunit-like protein